MERQWSKANYLQVCLEILTEGNGLPCCGDTPGYPGVRQDLAQAGSELCPRGRGQRRWALQLKLEVQNLDGVFLFACFA